MHKRRALIGAGIVVVLVLIGVGVWFFALAPDDGSSAGVDQDDPATLAAQEFAAAWVRGQLDKAAVTKASGDVAATSAAITKDLGVASPTKVEITGVEPVAPAAGDDDAPKRAEATATVTWQLDPTRTWTYDTVIPVVEQPAVGDADPVWAVDWSPAVLHRRLVAGDQLDVVRLPAARGEILGPDGKPIVGMRPVVEVGIQPGATTDRASAAQAVAGLVGVDAAALSDRVVNAGADDFVSAITLRKEAYDEVAGSLQGIAGVVTHEGTLPLAPTRDFARALLGTADEATAANSKGRVAVGDTVGLSGLQASQDAVLAGQPGISIRLKPAPNSGRVASVLKDFPAVDGQPVQITIDPKVQAAADEVMDGAPKPAALVAIRASTGDVLAVANGPAGANGYNRAMVGAYPPGSTFKVASGLALLENGLTPDTVVDCPATIVVGKEFSNAEGEVLGSVPFRKDFADSCNTAFVGQSRSISAQQLADTATKLGYRKLDLGAPMVAASVPSDGNETEHAADMIGQGKVQATPFHVALASASVASGRSVQPRLIIDPKHPDPTLGEPLPAAPVAALRDLMRGVVTDGTGGALLGVPGGDVAGKTGTAEFGTEDPPQTHAWFTGFQGDIAFAVLVEDGGFGGQVAAPLAAEFLSKLAEG